MKMRRAMSMITAVVMVFSLFAGIGINPSVSDAKVKISLPKTTGLYVSEYVKVEWGDQQKKDVILTDKDQNGNTVLVDKDGNHIPYKDQDNPEYLTKGIEEGWGINAQPVQGFWLDYVDGNKITHVPLSKIKVTHLDGSACNDVKLSTFEADSRVILLKSSVVEPVLLTYTGAKKNNKMIMQINLMPNFYTTDKPTVEGYPTENINVVEGKTKDIYFHLSDTYNPDEFGYIVDPTNALTVAYRDESKQEDVVLVGPDAAEYASVSVVSDKDPHNMSYKITFTGKKPTNGGDFLALVFKFKEYRKDDKDSAEDQERYLGVRVVKGDVLSVANVDAFGVKNGNFAIVDEDAFESNTAGLGMFGQPEYFAFRYTDEDGNTKYITDFNDLSLYQWDMDENGKDVILDKLSDDVMKSIQVTKVGSSPIFRVVIPKNDAIRVLRFVITLKDRKPDPDKGLIRYLFIGGKYTVGGFYSSKEASVDTYLSEITTDGTKAQKLFFGYNDVSVYKSVSFGGVTILSDSKTDLGRKVKNKSVKMTGPEGQEFKYGEELTIPAGVLTGSALLVFNLVAENEDGSVHTVRHNLFVDYKAPKKGTKFTSGGVTYKVTGKNAVSVSKVKTSAKSVTIPASVGALKVTGIAAKAMKGCKKLTKITVKSTAIKSVGKGAFTGVPAKATASVPKAKKNAYAKLFKKGGFKGKVK